MTSDENSLPTIEGVQQASKIATAAMNGNFLGPFVTAVTLVSDFFFLSGAVHKYGEKVISQSIPLSVSMER